MQEGGLLIYPTEAVYGIGCDPFNHHAIQHLFELKKRPETKGLILIAANFEQIKPFISFSSAEMQKAWPGPVTFIAPASQLTPPWLLGEDNTIAVRVSAHQPCIDLCLAFKGPIVSTSANPSGAPPARTRLKARLYFPEEDIVYLPGSIGDLAKPTSIYHAVTGKKIR